MATMMVLAGGTGGHVIPALNVAAEMKQRGFNVEWIGTENGIEARLVPAADITLHLIDVSGVRGKGLLRKIKLPFVLAHSVWQSYRIIKKAQPKVVLGMGGFAAGPGGIAARLAGVPVVVHEQNAVAGLTNAVLARMSQRVLTGFKRVAGLKEYVWVGNPVSDAIIALAQQPLEHNEDSPNTEDKKRILIVGGSQGAGSLNRYLPKILANTASELNSELDISHQCGRGQADEVAERYKAAGINANTHEFIDDMASEYAKADIIICRAGAMTVAEVSAAGLAAVFVPYPHAVSDHQTKNAEQLVSAGAALCVPENELENGQWIQSFTHLLTNDASLEDMSRAARTCAKPFATRDVADICEELSNA